MTTTNTLATITDALHACQVAITQLAPSVAQTNALAHVQDALRLVEQLQTQPTYEPVSLATYSTDDATLAVADNELSIITENGGDYIVIEWTLPTNMRLCRLVQQQPQEGQSHE